MCCGVSKANGPCLIWGLKSNYPHATHLCCIFTYSKKTPNSFKQVIKTGCKKGPCCFHLAQSALHRKVHLLILLKLTFIFSTVNTPQEEVALRKQAFCACERVCFHFCFFFMNMTLRRAWQTLTNKNEGALSCLYTSCCAWRVPCKSLSVCHRFSVYSSKTEK